MVHLDLQALQVSHHPDPSGWAHIQVPDVQCVCVRAYTYKYIHVHTHLRQKNQENTDQPFICLQVQRNIPRQQGLPCIDKLDHLSLVPQRPSQSQQSTQETVLLPT